MTPTHTPGPVTRTSSTEHMPSIYMRIRQLCCGLFGHDDLRTFDKGCMFLRCVDCGHESHGWQVGRTKCETTYESSLWR